MKSTPNGRCHPLPCGLRCSDTVTWRKTIYTVTKPPGWPPVTGSLDMLLPEQPEHVSHTMLVLLFSGMDLLRSPLVRSAPLAAAAGAAAAN